MQNIVSIANAKKDQNLFILDFTTSRNVGQVNTQAIMIIELGRLIYLVNRIKKVYLWYRKFGYASNARIIRVSKLLTEIKDFGKNYNLVEI